MQWTGLNELREKYLSFFESKGHLRLPSFPLIPQNDHSLLLINSGMAPMKKYFTGEITPPSKRVTTCQKCIRTPDIERVGITARHGTYFEMLGNFSFGDYFKKEAIAWAWEFCTEVMEMDPDRLYISIYQDDDEAYDIWTKKVGVRPDHMVRLGKEDNFWEHGSGPCGPCSEIYYDRGEKYGCGSPTCGVGCDCDRYVEIWNNVFSQFNNDGQGNYTELAQKNIDTGMGLERLACVSQGVDNLFLVDTVQNIMKHVSRITGVAYGQSDKSDISLRVITDHIRSTTFMIGDGVMPSNNGRGYVLRRLLRRAARHGRLLGTDRAFLSEVCETVIAENESAYPELREKADFIKKIIATEEESFHRTIDQGMQLLDAFAAEHAGGTLPGEVAFKLQDTYGFPVDLTVEILADRGIGVDVDAFRKIYDRYRADTREKRKNAGAEAWEGKEDPFAGMPATEFKGYDHFSLDAQVAAIAASGERITSAAEGDEAVLVLSQTPFYGESGGQAGDTGRLTNGRCDIQVVRTVKNHAGVILHQVKVISGEISTGDTVHAEIDSELRRAAMRNHTAAHLLQASLRTVLGTHVEQAGQLVNAQRMRFDFTHFSALTADELDKVEKLVNDAVLSAIPVDIREMPIEEAKKLGAMALFGEKYGDVVRVVRCGDRSVEFCGGTHVSNTAQIGLFKILSESSVAAGVRRIEAVTGTGVLELLGEYQSAVHQLSAVFKSGESVTAVTERAVQLTAELKEKEKELESVQNSIAAGKISELAKQAVPVGGLRLITSVLEGADSDALRAAGDKARDLGSDIVAVLAGVNRDAGKVTFAVSCGKDAVAAGAHAGNLVREIAKLAGGNGGGRPDSAMAGGKEIENVGDALSAAAGLLAGMLK